MLFIILHEVLPMAHLLSGKTVVSLAAPVSVNRSKKINDVAHDHLTKQDTIQINSAIFPSCTRQLMYVFMVWLQRKLDQLYLFTESIPACVCV